MKIGIYFYLTKIFWQKFYRNVPWVVPNISCPDLWIWLVAMATEMLNLRKHIQKSYLGIKLKLYGKGYSISLYKNGVWLPLLMRFRYYGNLKFPLTSNGVSTVFWQTFYRHVPWVLLYLTYNFCSSFWWLVAMATDRLSKKISNDQELIQSDPTSCPQNQTGND